MSKRAKTVEFSYVVKEPLTGRYFDDDRELTTIGGAEQFFTQQDAENYRDMLAHRLRHGSLTVVKIRVTTEEV